MKSIIKKLQKRSDWRDLKLIFENFQSEFVDLLLKNYDKVSDRFLFGRTIDLLNGLRGGVQALINELQFSELMQHCFGDIEEPVTKGDRGNERIDSENRIRNQKIK